MIDSVRNTVLSTLNKNNYGYISPSDFNLYAKQAQLDIFENYFYQYNYQINKENANLSGTGYADITKGYEESIDIFSVSKSLYYDSGNKFFTPSQTTTSDDYYLLNSIDVFINLLGSGTNTSTNANDLIDSGADFVASGVSVGDIVTNTTTKLTAEVTGVAVTTLAIDANIFLATPNNYAVYGGGVSERKVAERVSQNKITMLNSSLLTAPSSTFPAYTLGETTVSIFPKTFNTYGAVRCQYIRYPNDPKWTYVTLTDGAPVFNASAGDYQDFEVPLGAETTLVLKILQYAGMSIREIMATQFGQSLEAADTQNEK